MAPTLPDNHEILDLLPEGIIISDRKTRVHYANKAALQLMKLSKEDLAHQSLFKRVHPTDQANVKRYAKMLAAEKHMITTRRFRCGDGTYIYLERNTILLENGMQLSLCRDVTLNIEEHRQLERFMSIASHELRNPLSSIQLNAELLGATLKNSPDTGHMRMIHSIRDQVHVQNRMISDFLDISKITKGKLSFAHEPVEVRALLTEAVQHVGALTGRTYICSARTDCVVWGDRDRLYQVFFNLLQNAAKYSSHPSKIRVTLSPTKGTCKVSVKDYGIGIKSADQKRIFQDFFQANEKMSEGLGIGLFLVSIIIRAHHGTIDVESTPGNGSTFTVSLPRAKESNQKAGTTRRK